MPALRSADAVTLPRQISPRSLAAAHCAPCAIHTLTPTSFCRFLPYASAQLVSEEIGDLAEQFVSPIVVPRAPARMYFRFGKPIYTAGRKEELSEKAAAKELYDDIRNDVEGGIQYLLKKREEDPFKDLSWRLLFEGAWRGRRAPTFRP